MSRKLRLCVLGVYITRLRNDASSTEVKAWVDICTEESTGANRSTANLARHRLSASQLLRPGKHVGCGVGSVKKLHVHPPMCWACCAGPVHAHLLHLLVTWADSNLAELKYFPAELHPVSRREEVKTSGWIFKTLTADFPSVCWWEHQIPFRACDFWKPWLSAFTGSVCWVWVSTLVPPERVTSAETLRKDHFPLSHADCICTLTLSFQTFSHLCLWTADIVADRLFRLRDIIFDGLLWGRWLKRGEVKKKPTLFNFPDVWIFK